MAVLGGESDWRKEVTGSLFLSSSMASLPLWSALTLGLSGKDSDQIIVELNFWNCEPTINISNFYVFTSGIILFQW